jgi:RimJ/RimL family protein N-acetyltransferase
MSFELQPTLRGNLIELRPLQRADFAGLLAAAGDPLIWEQHPEPDRYQPEIFQRYFDSGIECGGALLAVDLASGRVIGSSRYHDYDPSRGEIEIGYTFLARAYWGGEFNREMKTLMLHHAFRFVKRVRFTVGPDNLRSQMALTKIGAKPAGTMEKRSRDGSVRWDAVFVIEK